MQVVNELILDTTTGIIDSGWVNAASLSAYSVEVNGLEAGGFVKVYLSNAFQPTSDNKGVAHISMSPDSYGNTIGQPTIMANWFRVIKSPSSTVTPTATTVRMFGVSK